MSALKSPSTKTSLSRPYRLSTASRRYSSSLNASVVPDLVGMYTEKMHVGRPDVSSWVPTILWESMGSFLAILSSDFFHAMATPPLSLTSLGLQNSGSSSGGCAEAWKDWFSSYVCSQCSEIAIMSRSFRSLFMYSVLGGPRGRATPKKGFAVVSAGESMSGLPVVVGVAKGVVCECGVWFAGAGGGG